MSSTRQTLPFVSIIIPTRNSEKYIEKCIESLLKIDYPRCKYEIIIVDGKSIDNTVKIAEKYTTEVIVNEKIIQSVARNLGAKRAKGDILAFVDSDVIVDKYWLKNAIIHFENPKVDAVGSLLRIPKNSNWMEKAWFVNLKSKFEDNPTEVTWLQTANLIFRKNMFFELGGFDESLKSGEDVDMGLRTNKKGYINISDPSVKAIHLGYPKTIGTFFIKQFFYGCRLLKLINKHGLRPLLPITAFTCYFTSCYIISIVGLFMNLSILMLSCGMLIIFTLWLSIKASKKNKEYNYIPHIMLLYFLMGTARFLALFIGKLWKKYQ